MVEALTQSYYFHVVMLTTEKLSRSDHVEVGVLGGSVTNVLKSVLLGYI